MEYFPNFTDFLFVFELNVFAVKALITEPENDCISIKTSYKHTVTDCMNVYIFLLSLWAEGSTSLLMGNSIFHFKHKFFK